MKKETILLAHGGCGLINRNVHEVEREYFKKQALKHKVYTISNEDLATFYRIADGTLSPLEGPMNKKEFYSVLDKEFIVRNGKKYAWTIPLAFPMSKQENESFEIGETVAVKDEHGKNIGIIEINDLYLFDKHRYNKSIYGTDRKDHPGVRITMNDEREFLMGGRIWALSQHRHPVYGKYMLTPEETRLLFQERKWQRIVAFQTRNPLHRAHEYVMVHALEKLMKKGLSAGIALNPLVGKTKSDDVPSEVRMKTYEALIQENLIGDGDKDAAFWGENSNDMSERIHLIGLNIKMFYAGPKEAVMHAIYRQNHGFSDLIIGRRHADAPFDDGTQVWGDFDAQDKFDNLKGGLLIKPFKVGFAAYYEELGRVCLVDECKQKGYRQVSIAGKELRKKLKSSEPIDERVMRKPVAQILKEFYQQKAKEGEIKSKNITWHDAIITKNGREAANKHKAAVIWLTGLPSSGKSTIAVELQSHLFKRGCQVYILDGDNVRHGLNKNLGFSPEDRAENIRRVGESAKLFADAGFLVIASFISPYRKDRDQIRNILPKGDFIEVFVNTSLKECEKRDPKGLYKKARSGAIPEFTGISAPYEAPADPEIIVKTEQETKEESAQYIAEYLENNEYIPKKLQLS